MTTSLRLPLVVLVALLTTATVFATDPSDPADTPQAEPAAITTPAPAADADEKSDDATAESAEPRWAEPMLFHDAPVTLKGSFCENWEYTGCCSNGQKKSVRVCFDSSGNRTWQSKCEGSCPL